MKILYITSSGEDYLQDQVLIGLRSMYGDDVVDYPKKEVLYEGFEKPKNELYGCGFTIWKTLPDLEIDRTRGWQRAMAGEFDLIVFGSVWRQTGMFARLVLSKMLIPRKTKVCFIDGEDQSLLFAPACFFGKYFKRELMKNSCFPSVREINFSIPSGKIRASGIPKNRMFAKHVQCEEAYKIKEIRTYCQKSYGFSDERAYYDDIAQAEYAVTMKKAGWDCMRHYEIAANGTVPCFYGLDQKPTQCAPHGLVDMKNVVAFKTADELMEKIDYIKATGLYPQLQENALEWARSNSCEVLARRMLEQI